MYNFSPFFIAGHIYTPPRYVWGAAASPQGRQIDSEKGKIVNNESYLISVS